MPFTMLIAPGGEIVYTHEGIIDPLEVKQEIIKKIGDFLQMIRNNRKGHNTR